MPLEQALCLIMIIGLVIVIYTQSQKIKRLESRINTLLKSTQNGEDERLVYLRENLAHLDKVKAIKAIKALRDHYPELGLVEANKLWEQNQSNAKILR